jgi:hypothetical protein
LLLDERLPQPAPGKRARKAQPNEPAADDDDIKFVTHEPRAAESL